MSTHKIKTGVEIPSEEFVNQQKPHFSQVVKGFKGFNLNLIQKTWLIGGATGVVAIVAVVTAVLLNQTSEPATGGVTTPITNPSDSAYFVSPLPEHDIPFETFQFDPQQQADFTSALGSIIHVPSGAFTDLQGAAVAGPVQIRFREFHNAMDMFRSGAPMEYDSAGEHRTFESAGMFEILAYQGDQPLKLADNISIDVDLVTYNDDPKFNLYYLDTNARNWAYLDKSAFSEVEHATEIDIPEVIEKKPAVSELSVVSQIRPIKAGSSKFIFKVEYKKNDFPELQAYNNVLFEVDETKSKFSTALYDVNWKEVSIKKSRLQGQYILQLVRPDTTIKVYVKPVFASKDYQEAIDKYNATQQQKDLAYQEKEKASAQIVNRREELYDQSSYYASVADRRAPVGFRTVNVARLGTFNCDYPMPVNNYAFTPTFVVDGQQIDPRKIYVSDISINAIYVSDQNGEFRCDRNLALVMWIITQDNQMAIWSAADFKRITKGTTNPVFEVQLLNAASGMKVLERALRGDNDLRIEEEVAVVEEEKPLINESVYTKEAPPQLTISAYPNPARDNISIYISGAPDDYRPQLRFYNAAGALIKEMGVATSGESTSVNISAWKPGVYFCQIEVPGSSGQTLKFIKN